MYETFMIPQVLCCNVKTFFGSHLAHPCDFLMYPIFQNTTQLKPLPFIFTHGFSLKAVWNKIQVRMESLHFFLFKRLIILFSFGSCCENLSIHFKGGLEPRGVGFLCPSEVCIQGLSHLQVNDIAAGVTHSCAVTWRFCAWQMVDGEVSNMAMVMESSPFLVSRKFEICLQMAHVSNHMHLFQPYCFLNLSYVYWNVWAYIHHRNSPNVGTSNIWLYNEYMGKV